MNCKDFESMIHEVVSRRVADKTKQLDAFEHAGHCLWCALRLDEETKLTQRLQAFASTLQGQRAPLRVEEALVQAFRERTLRATMPLFGLAGKRLWRGLSWGLVFAATVAIAWIGIFHLLRLHPRSSASPPQAANHQPLAANEASQAKQEPIPRSPVATDVAPRQDGRLERAVLDESASELTTDFIPLGTCDDSQCMDGAMLVRVTLPAEAPMAFGLGMDNGFAMDGLVQADVALGSDGLPFAIRFVD
jgi:hypothetical protein